MDQDHILPALTQVVIEDKGPPLACVRVRQALGTLLPAAAQGREMEDRASPALRVGPNAWSVRRNQRRLTCKLQGEISGSRMSPWITVTRPSATSSRSGPAALGS